MAEPSRWNRYDSRGRARIRPAPSLVGSIQVAYGTPTKYELTIYRVIITRRGHELGWSVESSPTRRWGSAA
ncbi:MAG: hypothetical protein IPK24_19880 [Kineosporiaceae bacterium]|nr:hypothetical protein [Kineosporiaceae bacterium]